MPFMTWRLRNLFLFYWSTDHQPTSKIYRGVVLRSDKQAESTPSVVQTTMRQLEVTESSRAGTAQNIQLNEVLKPRSFLSALTGGLLSKFSYR
jgi:hypothetical protein